MKAYVKCPLDGDPRQKSCSLVEHYKEHGNTNECQHQQTCREMRQYINEETHNETIQRHPSPF